MKTLFCCQAMMDKYAITPFTLDWDCETAWLETTNETWYFCPFCGDEIKVDVSE